MAFAVIARSGLVDPVWYSRQLGRASTMSRLEATAHYVWAGRVRGLSPHPLFEPEYVDPTGWRTNPVDPLTRYLRDPKNWTTATHPWFDGGAYLTATPAARSHPYGPLGHFAATAHSGTPLPVVPIHAEHAPTPITWGEAREFLLGGEPREGRGGADLTMRTVQEAKRVVGRVSILVRATGDWQRARQCLAALLAETDAGDLKIIVVDNASRRSVGTILAATGATDPRIHVVRHHIHQSATLNRNLAYAQSTGEIVVFLDDSAIVQRGWLPPLLRALDAPDVLAAQPLLVHPDHTVRCAGMVFPRRGTLPVHFLDRHPVEDARRVGTHIEVPAVTAAAMAIRAENFAALDGFDLDQNGWADVDLCLRLQETLRNERHAAAGLAVVTDSVVVQQENTATDRARGDAHAFQRRWSGSTPRGDERLWRDAGFTVSHYSPEISPAAARPQLARPVLTRPVTLVSQGPARGLPALRWAIKTAAPAGEAGKRWGDVHFARALAAALERLGQTAVVDPREAHHRGTAYLDDVVLTLRGLHPVSPQPGRINLLWVISHPDRITRAEMDQYDRVFAASTQWAARMSESREDPVIPLLQCTDPERFHPGVAQPDTGHRCLFVGNSHRTLRPVVRDAIDAGADIAVYGLQWEGLLDARYIHGSHLPNSDVAAAYRSAGVVLNDHWSDMRREGFLSNRLFDATAAGARVVSDDVAGMAEIFGKGIATYRGVEELSALLARPFDESFPSEEDRLLVAERIRREHSFDARAGTLVKAASRLWER
ncbi:glycosyltransferase [Actinopolymorpha sp. B17G11]|uniref:glycosyltransferase n=1 Tax=Actinopolymorpha sp. B17G11 TaxID=3160861 RepID=UPI0032E526EC